MKDKIDSVLREVWFKMAFHLCVRDKLRFVRTFWSNLAKMMKGTFRYYLHSSNRKSYASVCHKGKGSLYGGLVHSDR